MEEFEIVTEAEYSYLIVILKDKRIQDAIRYLRINILSPINEQLIENGKMRKFLAPEALELRHVLETLCLYHAFNTVFTNISFFMKVCDLAFVYLTFISSLELSKVHVVAYSVASIILIFIGLSHLPYFNNFRSTPVYLYYASELIVLSIGVSLVLYCFF